MEWYTHSCTEVLDFFHSNKEQGLSKKEIEVRQKRFGQNKISKRRTVSKWHIALQQFENPLVFILLFAAFTSVCIRGFDDALVISIAISVNAIVGFLQEWKAEKATAKLLRYEAHQCVVVRDGALETISTHLLVPGDIVHLQAGARVPADLRLLTVLDLTVDESLLFGESKPVRKITDVLDEKTTAADRYNLAYYGTYVASGKGCGIVVATGVNTLFGSIAAVAQQQEQELTPIQKQLRQLTRFLTVLMGGVLLVMLGLGYAAGFAYRTLIETAIAFAVASLPEGLLLGVTVVLAIGMQKMARRKALVKRLSAAETLGGVSVICTDKTGTLTRGYPSVARMITMHEEIQAGVQRTQEIDFLVELSVLNNDASIDWRTKNRVGSALELALLENAHAAGVEAESLVSKKPRIDEIEFSSQRKYMATLHNDGAAQLLIIKGAHETIISLCDLPEQDHTRFVAQASALAHQGLQVMAFAYKNGSFKSCKEGLAHMVFGGIIAFEDALRPQAIDTIKELKGAGIIPVLITGDYPDTALYIAKKVGITSEHGKVLTGEDLDEISDVQLYQMVPEVAVYARVSPQHKVRIVQSWQARNKVVAMTGDGVNDILAIRVADIGVALASGSDVTQDVADIVLLNNNLASLVAGVEQGRVLFDNIRKIIVALLIDSFGEVVLLVGAMLIGLPMPVTAVQILWINLIADAFPNLALAVEPGEEDVMQQKPRPYGEAVLNVDMKKIIFAVGVGANLSWLLVYVIFRHTSYDPHHFQTSMFTFLSFSSLPLVFSARSFRKSVFEMNFWSNPAMLWVIIIELLVQIAALYIPPLRKILGIVAPDFYDWLLILAFVWFELISLEVMKFFYRKKCGTENLVNKDV